MTAHPQPKALTGTISRTTIYLAGSDVYGGTPPSFHDSTSTRVIMVHTHKIKQDRTGWLRSENRGTSYTALLLLRSRKSCYPFSPKYPPVLTTQYFSNRHSRRLADSAFWSSTPGSCDNPIGLGYGDGDGDRLYGQVSRKLIRGSRSISYWFAITYLFDIVYSRTPASPLHLVQSKPHPIFEKSTLRSTS